MKQSSKFWFVLMSSRPISWVNTAYPFLAGYFVTTHQLTNLAIVGTVYFLIPYNLLMYGINDVFDYESDLRNPRKGGVEGLKLERKLHPLIVTVAVVSNIPFLVYMFLQGNTAANIALAFVVFMVVAYSAPLLRFKERPVLDSVTSSIHFVGPLVYALLLTGWSDAYLPYVIAFFLWGMASHAFGAVQDIIADRQAKIGSIATVFGARKTVLFATILYSMAAVLLAFTGWAGFVVALAGTLYAQNSAHFLHLTDKTCEQAHNGWKRFLVLNWITGAVITMVLVYTYFY